MKKEGGKWLPKCVSCLTGSPRGQRPKARAAEASLWLPPSKRPSVQRLLWCSCFCGLLSAAASLPHPHPLRLLAAGHTVTPGPVHPLDLPAALGTFLPPLCHCPSPGSQAFALPAGVLSTGPQPFSFLPVLSRPSLWPGVPRSLTFSCFMEKISHRRELLG